MDSHLILAVMLTKILMRLTEKQRNALLNGYLMKHKQLTGTQSF